ncbi:MAG: fibrobacter succinogenes major paralogous domain-containing protein [Bacteroidetes bacterium]|nr:fibrobacter succinogenes major paralogous domain-containing protein [Bacteroidota bacterium]
MKMIKNLPWMFMALIVISTGCKKEKKEVFASLTTTAATGITGSAAVTGGSITNTGNSTISQSGIVYATHATPTLTDSLRNNTSGGNTFTINLTALNANTVYYARAFAINATGTAYGNQVTFTTSAGLATVTTTPLGAISTSAATAPSGGTIVNTGGAAITASGVCWSTKPHPTVADNETNDQVTNNSFTSTLSLLAANTTYYYRAYATNSFGTAYGNELTFNSGSTETVQDVDGNVYHTVTINGQTWMAENLRVTHYQNGNPIYNAFGDNAFDWYNTPNNPCLAFVNGDTTKATRLTYGLVYNEWAVVDSRNIAPAGWHVATVRDWENLEVYEGVTAADTVGFPTAIITDGAVGPKLQVGGSSGLNLQLAGRYRTSPSFNFGLQGYFWTSGYANYAGNPQLRYLISVFSSSSSHYQAIDNYYAFGEAASVRCVKN